MTIQLMIMGMAVMYPPVFLPKYWQMKLNAGEAAIAPKNGSELSHDNSSSVMLVVPTAGVSDWRSGIVGESHPVAQPYAKHIKPTKTREH